MPGFDGTGPAGRGPMTGGARGWCNPYSAPAAGYRPYRAPYPFPARPNRAPGLAVPRWGVGPGFWGRGRGLGWGRGLGRGRGWWW
jgi:hypothetical protein